MTLPNPQHQKGAPAVANLEIPSNRIPDERIVIGLHSWQYCTDIPCTSLQAIRSIGSLHPIKSLVRRVYDTIRKNRANEDEQWDGWHKLWRLPVAPRVKTFIWRLLHRRLPTLEMLYALNIGPQSSCPNCGLTNETINHVMFSCRIATQCWEIIAGKTGIDTSTLANIADGEWILSNEDSGCINIMSNKALVANCAWGLWKARCEKVFNNTVAQPARIVQRAIQDMQEYTWKLKGQIREYLHLAVFNNSITLMCDASWGNDSLLAGAGFVIIKGSYTVLAAGCAAVEAGDSTLAEIVAMEDALKQSRRLELKPGRLCTDCIQALDLLTAEATHLNWEYRRGLELVQEQLSWVPMIEMKYCPREFNVIADKLANYGRRKLETSLFHRESDKPRWLEDIVNLDGLTF